LLNIVLPSITIPPSKIRSIFYEVSRFWTTTQI
jgi:hypothetical protein